VLLLDEPLGALDAKLRRSLKVELKALQERVGITFVYVTHDQEEALTMSDRIAVMNAGRIAQVGTPQEVYESPADAYVADFLGAANLLQIVVTERVRGGASTLKLGGIALTTSNELPAEPGPISAGTVAQAVVPNEDAVGWSQGTPVHVHLPADALRVLAGDAEPAPADAEAAVAS